MNNGSLQQWKGSSIRKTSELQVYDLKKLEMRIEILLPFS